MSVMHHFRRQAHRAAQAPRSSWRRVYTYREEPNIRGGVHYIPMSYDAPYGDEDARFWDRVAATLIAAFVVGLVVFGIVTWA